MFSEVTKDTNFRVKFYGGWIIAEAICIACNLGTVEKEDGTVDYSSIINIDIYNVRNATKLK